ncbi:MAG: phosphate transport system ATP-binding protein [Chloroflexi bacterium]|nr:MAG: phosphate transport system ATP-binding protein [Chloroflexota bacterium]
MREVMAANREPDTEAMPPAEGEAAVGRAAAGLRPTAARPQQAGNELFDEIEGGRGAVRHQLDEEVALQLRDVSVYYGEFQALDGITFDIPKRRVTALIGPSGCGKSTLLRCFNRMNDLIPDARMVGEITFAGRNLLDPSIDSVDVRRRIGMVFQKPNPFPKSIFANVAFGPRINGFRGDLEALVEESLRRAALWGEVKDDLNKSALALSGGQQQRLCIARAIAVQPEIILMDEPASALDPVATLKIEDLMRELAAEYTILVVTHNMQQAARVSSYTAFLLAGEERTGRLVEFGPTQGIFTNPEDRRTEDYITGRYG